MSQPDVDKQDMAEAILQLAKVLQNQNDSFARRESRLILVAIIIPVMLVTMMVLINVTNRHYGSMDLKGAEERTARLISESKEEILRGITVTQTVNMERPKTATEAREEAIENEKRRLIQEGKIK